MTHEDAGKYKAKHPPGTAIQPHIAEALQAAAIKACVTCAAAHKIAAEARVLPAEVGIAIDLMEYRITTCQMGLFGYPDRKKRVKPLPQMPDPLRNDILAATTDNRISCAACWKIAEARNITRMEVAGACETLAVRIKPCQLGAF
jgi:hypothetical protein